MDYIRTHPRASRIYNLYTPQRHGITYTYTRYELEAIRLPITENNIGAPLAPQKCNNKTAMHRLDTTLYSLL